MIDPRIDRAKGMPSVPLPTGSVPHRLLAVASALPRHWFELEDLATRRGLHLCDKSSITNSLKTLSNRGLLKRHHGQKDGNLQQYTLTPQGEAVLDALHR